MDNQPWDKARLTEWKKFWESEMGKEAVAKMNKLKTELLDESMRRINAEEISWCTARAAGIQIVLDDIQTGIKMADEAAKREKEAEQSDHKE